MKLVFGDMLFRRKRVVKQLLIGMTCASILLTIHQMLTANIMRGHGIWQHDKVPMIESSPTLRCKQPSLKVWPQGFKEYYVTPKIYTCNIEHWLRVQNGTLRIKEDIKRKYGNISCELVPFVGAGDFKTVNGELEKLQSDEIHTMTQDFYQVECQSEGGIFISEAQAGISFKKNVHKRARNVQKKGLDLNILMFGFDSASRMSWMRNMPQTIGYLQQIGGVVLNGYTCNIVGDGTPRALMPILTGYFDWELPESRRGYPSAKPVDNHPWIWKDLQELGYVTQWGEDAGDIGTFSNRFLGFTKSPVDHYYRHFDMFNRDKICVGGTLKHKQMMNWVRQLYDMYPDRPKFSFMFHSIYTQYSYAELGNADVDLKMFVTELNNAGHLDNTLLILMSDHGARSDEIRRTPQGKLEERMPFFSLRLPPIFLKQHPQIIHNLRLNADRLTSPFDIHATFENIINSNERDMEMTQRGISLFQKIPEERTCRSAGVKPHWCACLETKEIPINDTRVTKAIKKVMETFNSHIMEFTKKCSKLYLERIINAVILMLSEDYKSVGNYADSSQNEDDESIQITFETGPGSGMFEATVTHDTSTDQYTLSMNSVSRINDYNDHPKCVQKEFPHLRPYCYCLQ